MPCDTSESGGQVSKCSASHCEKKKDSEAVDISNQSAQLLLLKNSK